MNKMSNEKLIGAIIQEQMNRATMDPDEVRTIVANESFQQARLAIIAKWNLYIQTVEELRLAFNKESDEIIEHLFENFPELKEQIEVHEEKSTEEE